MHFFFGTICAILRRLLEIDCLMSWIATFLEIELNFLIYRWDFQNIKTFSIFFWISMILSTGLIYIQMAIEDFILSPILWKIALKRLRTMILIEFLGTIHLLNSNILNENFAHKNSNGCMLTPKLSHSTRVYVSRSVIYSFLISLVDWVWSHPLYSPIKQGWVFIPWKWLHNCNPPLKRLLTLFPWSFNRVFLERLLNVKS